MTATNTITIKTGNPRPSAYYDKDSGALDVDVVLGGRISVEGEITLCPDKINGGYSAGPVASRDYWVSGKMLACLERWADLMVCRSIGPRNTATPGRTYGPMTQADGALAFTRNQTPPGGSIHLISSSSAASCGRWRGCTRGAMRGSRSAGRRAEPSARTIRAR